MNQIASHSYAENLFVVTNSLNRDPQMMPIDDYDFADQKRCSAVAVNYFAEQVFVADSGPNQVLHTWRIQIVYSKDAEFAPAKHSYLPLVGKGWFFQYHLIVELQASRHVMPQFETWIALHSLHAVNDSQNVVR